MMSLDGNKEVCFIVVAVCFLMGIVVFNMIVNFKIIDVFYIIGCIIFLIRYIYLKITL